jgi:hypothetical protein
MKTRIALIPAVALAVLALGAGLSGPAAAPPSVGAPAATMLQATPEADHSQPVRRSVLKVLPTVTVVPSREERLAALGADEEPSLMFDVAVDRAAVAIARPVGAALPRAQLGNPFYDFARLRRSTAD